MVKFFMSEGQRIFSLISSVMQSVGAIASGNISAAVAGVETSLAKSIPVALSFMSKIVKVSGIGTKIKAIINKVKSRIEQVVSRVMDKAATLVAKVVGSGANLANAAKDKVRTVVNKIKDGIFGKKTFQAGKEQHSIWVDVRNGNPKLMIASTPREADAQLNAVAQEAAQKGCLPKVQPVINEARGVVATAKADLAKGMADPSKANDQEMSIRSSNIVNRVQQYVKNVFDELAKHAGNTDKMPLTRVEFTSKNYDAQEYRLQVAEQQNAINRMTIKVWLGDRSNFLAKVGDPIAKKKFYADSGRHGVVAQLKIIFARS